MVSGRSLWPLSERVERTTHGCFADNKSFLHREYSEGGGGKEKPTGLVWKPIES